MITQNIYKTVMLLVTDTLKYLMVMVNVFEKFYCGVEFEDEPPSANVTLSNVYPFTKVKIHVLVEME